MSEAQTGAAGTLLGCATCSASKPPACFSGVQRKLSAAQRRCSACVAAGREAPAKPAALPPPRPTAAAPPARSPAAPKPPQWTSGAPWPHACIGPNGLPELYPGPALWVRDIRGFLASLPPALRQTCAPGLPLLLEPYGTQVELDERYALLTAAYEALPGGARAARPWAQHAATFAAAGLRLQARDPGRPLSAVDLFTMRNGYAVDARVQLRAPAPRTCDNCKAPAAARCRCGEAYCSRECQAADWAAHRSICAVIEDTFELGLMMTSVWWSLQGVGTPRKD